MMALVIIIFNVIKQAEKKDNGIIVVIFFLTK
jgi:hypothetical protein